MDDHLSALVILAFALVAGPCAREGYAAEAAHVAVVAARDGGVGLQLQATGAIRARVQANLAFRTGGKLVERAIEVGQHVGKGQLIAKLDPRQQQADVAGATAILDAKRAVEAPAAVEFKRQKDLLAGGNGTAVAYDNALRAMRQAHADVVAAEAALGSAKEQLSYTALLATADGLIVARDAEVGRVVEAGTTIATLAVDGPRDAVFEVSEAIMARPLASPEVTVALASDERVRTIGITRTIAPIVDTTRGTIEVKIALDHPPPQMGVGVPVVGSAMFTRAPTLRLPWSALTASGGRPAVFVLGADGRASLRAVDILQVESGSFQVGAELKPDERIIAVGTQFVRPGQPVVEERHP